MYNVTVDIGNSHYKMTNLGPATVDIQGAGQIVFTDVGDRPFGPNHQTWGVCITFAGSVWAFRYEGQGELAVVYHAETKSLTMKPGASGTIANLTAAASSASGQ